MVPESFDADALAVYDGLLRQALRELRSPEAKPGQRVAWARVAEHALKRLPESEERIAVTLATAAKVLPSPMIVQRLVEGVWCCTADEGRLLRWVTALSEKAIRGEHWATFAELAYTSARLDGFVRDVTPEWARALRAAYADPNAWVALYMFAHQYVDKFGPTKSTAPDWLRLFASDRRLHDAVDSPARTAGRSWCPLCRRMGYR